jgi:UDP-N-acetylmuramate dehydrogenase
MGMNITENTSLQPYNTFGIDVSARYFATADSVDSIRDVLTDNRYATLPLFVLGGGSNILLTKNFDGLVLKNEIHGIEMIRETEEHYFVKSGAGVVWHDFVLHCIENNWAGIENLSLIPGNIGASPMQNIGAYGVEVKDVFDSLEAFEIATGEVKTFDGEGCQFGYRESVFKRALKGKHIITSVTFRLQKVATFNTRYGAIEQELERMGVTDLSIRAVSNAVINIRQSKLPDPAKIGNSGSFFKNPVISKSDFDAVKSNHPDVVAYPAGENQMKLAAGWLIDQAGWKGKTFENYGVHKNQALVLVNYGGATGQQIYNLSEEVLQSVSSKFGVQLEREVNIM